MTQDNGLVILGEFYNMIEASMVRGLIEAHGIECFSFDDFVRGGTALYAFGGVRLMVRSQDLERAQKILAEEANREETGQALAAVPWQVNILTLFPEMFPGSLGCSLSGKALENGIWQFKTVNIRDFALGVHKSVDDTPYGGGAGMVMRPDIIEKATLSVENPGRKIYLSPRGKPLTQSLAQELAQEPALTLLCGRYEGVDQRVLDSQNYEEISIGDYILSGGEPAALILMDACIRLLPGVLGNDETVTEESFASGLLEYPHYTRPAQWRSDDGMIRDVPDTLTSGNHANIAKWRRQEAENLTHARRPDLWQRYETTRQSPKKPKK